MLVWSTSGRCWIFIYRALLPLASRWHMSLPEEFWLWCSLGFPLDLGMGSRIVSYLVNQ